METQVKSYDTQEQRLLEIMAQADTVEDMIALGRKYGARWVTCGRRSKAGHPHHPLYLRADAQAEPFDVEEYVRAQQARAAAAVSGRPRRV